MLTSSRQDDSFSHLSTKFSFGLCFFSAVLLILAYPPFNISILAWIGLVPLMYALDRKRLSQAFGTGYLCGVIFFTGTLHWFIHISSSAGIPFFLAIVAVGLLFLYLSLYFGLFAWGFVFFQGKGKIWKIFLTPSIWAGLEFIRDRFFSGFGWVSLGHSQYQVLPMIQISDMTGVFGISFLIVMVNFFIKEIITAILHFPVTGIRALRRSSMIVCGFVLVTLGYGMTRLYAPVLFPRSAIAVSSLDHNMKVAVVQANIAQELKWQPPAWSDILERHFVLTQEAAGENPDLIIWPETSYPGFIWESQETFDKLKAFVANLKVPLLFGAITMEEGTYYNSAILLSREGEVIAQHNKLHLVPFGEYLPLRKELPFLSLLAPIADFTPGDQKTLFPILSTQYSVPGTAFSVLICFEDTISEVARALVNNGAHLLVNITNDAWFLDTNAPFLHLQAAVFQSIQNRKTLIRAANTGVSCFIDKYGRVYHYLENEQKKKTYIAGSLTETVALNDEKTFYTKFGDVFTYLCFGCILLGIIARKKEN